MAYKVKVNIKTRKGNKFVANLLDDIEYTHGMDYNYYRALDKVNNYFNRSRYDQYEIWKGKDSNTQKSYWRIQPHGSKYKATIVIERI